MHAKLYITCVLLGICASFVLWDIYGQPPKYTNTTELPRTKTKTPHTPFTFNTLDKNVLNSTDLKGKVIILNFWASWCVPCLIEFPDLIEVTSSYPDDVFFLAMSVDENPDNAKAFIDKINLPQSNRIIGLDTDKSISAKLFNTTKYPETYILDRNLNIRRHITGIIEWNSPAFKTYLENLIKEPLQ